MFGGVFLSGQLQSGNSREYTVKIIPHQGETVHSIRLPLRVFKYGLASLAVGAVLFVGAFSYSTYSFFDSKSDAAELHELRQVTHMQQDQLSQLAKKANAMQDEMDQLSQMERELRLLSGAAAPAEEVPVGTVHEGQGGPWIEPNVKNVQQALDNIQRRLDQSRASLEEIREALAEKHQRAIYQQQLARTIPAGWPTSGEISSAYGLRWEGTDFHPGVDIANDYGTPITATADGVVIVSGWNSGGYGNMVDIDHGNGIVTRYGHAQEVVVSPGQAVTRGQIIAFMGSTGFSTGPHLHYEVRINGEAVNPSGYL